MESRTNREIERYYFEQFRKHFALPAGQIEYADKPDIRINGEKLIGIEISRLYIMDGADPSSEQRQQLLRRKVLDRARQMYLSSGGRDIQLHVDFDPERPIISVDEAAVRLAALAHEIDDVPVTLVGENSGNASGLRYVRHDGPGNPGEQWLNVQVFVTTPLREDRLSAVVFEKALKADDYAPCHEYWLLLVVDFMDPAQDQTLALPPEYLLPSSKFQQVIVYKPQLGQVLQVPQAPLSRPVPR